MSAKSDLIIRGGITVILVTILCYGVYVHKPKTNQVQIGQIWIYESENPFNLNPISQDKILGIKDGWVKYASNQTEAYFSYDRIDSFISYRTLKEE